MPVMLDRLRLARFWVSYGDNKLSDHQRGVESLAHNASPASKFPFHSTRCIDLFVALSTTIELFAAHTLEALVVKTGAHRSH